MKHLKKRSPSLYDPSLDKDSCGVGFAVDIQGRKSRHIVEMGLSSLCRLEHRGAVGADPKTGDGSGILTQIPHSFFCLQADKKNIILPKENRYAIGFIYLPQNPIARKGIENLIEKVVVDEKQIFLGWRDVPIKKECVGFHARKTIPFMKQCFVACSEDIEDTLSFDRKLYLIRRVIDRRVRAEYGLDRNQYYVSSFSCRTIVYKGMLTADQLMEFYLDLQCPEFISSLALIHQRYSTNTFPTWDLAQPFRMIAHNGEINTVRGNQNWMAARQMHMKSTLYGKNLRRMLPIIMEGQSDSATFDSVLELLYMTGRSLPHTIMMMIPEAWSKKKDMPKELRAFYEYHAAMMEPWDGPAAIAFTDGEIIGATLDRNGLRPGRYIITRDHSLLMASEAGTFDIPPSQMIYSGRLRPGRMLLVDTRNGTIIQDEDIKQKVSSQSPYHKWVEENMIRLSRLPDPAFVPQPNHERIRERQRAFGYTVEELNLHLRSMALTGKEPIGSMGADSSLAILSEKPRSLFHYFKQQFAQVTNPAIDPIREELVMELTAYIGPESNLLDESPQNVQRLELEHPVLTKKDLAKIRHLSTGVLRTKTINILFDPDATHNMRNRLDQVCDEAAEAVRNGIGLIILSDRGVAENMAAIPSLLAVSAVHHSLTRVGLRTLTGLIVESGEPLDVNSFAALLSYGANAVNPYLAFESLADMIKEGYLPELKNFKEARSNYINAIGKGLLKIFSKMGISTLQSYCGAQMFEAIGIDSELANLYFTKTQTHIEGLSLEMLEEGCVRRHRKSYDPMETGDTLPTGSIHHYRKHGIPHLLSPEAIYRLQDACRQNDYEKYTLFADTINNQKESERVNFRGLFKILPANKPLPLDEVESEEDLVKRFSTGAMSFGSISWETHTDLAIAMNRIGGKSNTGEGGEDPVRFIPMKNGDSMRSAIKQVASGRFGVTAHYLVHADDIQIKIAQGAKPGEGGQLPGLKVDSYIARLRFSTPGVTLISPPPHHDIYSIEDIKQLIFDLKNVNPKARISVKLVSETGVGTVATGVAKAHADHILISGFEGGTGASPISSIHNAGTPWELGLSEAHQALVINGLRDRVFLGVDGKILTGRDVVLAALLGAEEFGFSAAPLIALGCVMMRKCHLNTCPVGIATQDQVLRKRYGGNPDHVVHYMYFVAKELRSLMAELGFKRFTDMVGKVERISFEPPRSHWKARALDFSRLLHAPRSVYSTGLFRSRPQEHGLDKQADQLLIQQAEPAIRKNKREDVTIHMDLRNTDRSIGAMLSGEIARRFGPKGIPDAKIQIDMKGTAGQSFGAFLAKGVSIHLTGLANDYVGKGLDGGRIVVKIDPASAFPNVSQHIIIGNTCLYGATSGEAYFQGSTGERFCVRNSGVRTVVEGVGDHGCEYMTGGRVVILGEVGRNFAAGMSGGIAYVYDPESLFTKYLNPEMIDLESLEAEDDIDECLDLITRHCNYTSSLRAGGILKDWEKEREHFLKVIPKDYKRVLLEAKESLQRGEDGKRGSSLHQKQVLLKKGGI